MIQWSWRIEDEQTILCGSWSEKNLLDTACDLLVGREVTDLALFGRLPEIALSLSGGRHVASFMTAEGDPAWVLFDRRAPRLITLGCWSGVLDTGL